MQEQLFVQFVSSLSSPICVSVEPLIHKMGVMFLITFFGKARGRFGEHTYLWLTSRTLFQISSVRNRLWFWKSMLHHQQAPSKACLSVLKQGCEDASADFQSDLGPLRTYNCHNCPNQKTRSLSLYIYMCGCWLIMGPPEVPLT